MVVKLSMNSPRMFDLRRHGCWAVALLALTLGCKAQVETTRVLGQVTYKDRPVAGGVVNFFPAAGGRPLAGVIDTEGHYQFDLPAGDYAVAVQSSPKYPVGFKEGDPLPPPDPHAVPTRYSLQKKSGLTATILKQEEPQTVDFALK